MRTTKQSVYVSKFDINTSWEGNQTGKKESVFEITINGETKKVSKDLDARFTGLPLNKKHTVIVRLEGKALESFFFSFEDYGCPSLWLDYYEMYGEWTLEKEASCQARK